jgi:hypothetical protein
MAKQISRDANEAGLEDCDSRCSAVAEEVRADRLPERLVGSIRDDPGDGSSSERTPFGAGPDTRVPVSSNEQRTHFPKVALQKRHNSLGNRFFKWPT